jgi:hypothetical protein
MSDMAENKSTESKSADSPFVTRYVEEQAPSLPSQNVDVQRDAPVIDSRLVEARNAEAKAPAARLK